MRVILIILAAVVSVSGANLVYNGGFELGMAGHSVALSKVGWNDFPESSGVLTNDAYAGAMALVIPPESGNAYYPRLVRLPTTVATNYTLTFYAKSFDTATDTLFLSIVNGTTAASATNSGFNPGTNWSCYTNTFYCDPTNGAELVIRIERRSQYVTLIDNVQLELGSAATDWAPMDAVEIRLIGDRLGNILLPGDESRAGIVSSATGTASKAVRVEVYDAVNTLLQCTTNTFSITSGLNTNWVTLPGTNGSMRVIARCAGSTTPAETVFTRLPAVVERSTLGAHLNPNHGQCSWARTNLGIIWNRSLSPGGYFRWSTIEPTEGAFTWTATDALVNASTNSVIFASINEPDSVPSWANTNAQNMIRLDSWSNFVRQVVARYKDRITYWEDINEPYDTWNSNDYALILSTTVAAVKAEDPTATFSCYGGVAYATWPNGSWVQLSTETKALIDAISVHLYPPDGNGLYEQTQPDSRYAVWKTWGSENSKPVFNTESGGYSYGPLRTIADLNHAYVEMWRGIHWDSQWRSLAAYWRSMGHGYQRFFYYDGRMGAYAEYDQDTHPTFWNKDHSLSTSAGALLWAAALVPEPTGGTILTNVACGGVMVEAYGVNASNGTAALVVWSEQKTNRTFSVTNAAFAVYDAMGNLLQTNVDTVAVGMLPRYWVSGSMGSNELWNTFRYATVSTNADATGPLVTVDESPFSTADGRIRLRWSVWDGTSTITNLSTRWALTNDVWSDWGNVRAVEVEPSDGIYTLSVQGKDASDNTTTATGPTFLYGDGPTTWYVSPTGTGDGTLGSPGGLSNAVVHAGWAASISAGDTVYLRGGTYAQGTNFWTVGFDGAAGNLVTWRAYSDELPKVDGPWRFGSNKHHRFWGIEFYDSHKNEWEGLTNPWLQFDDAGATGGSNEWINCVIHDVHNCFSGTSGGHLIRGCIFWYVGQTYAEHAIYPYAKQVYGSIGAWTSGEFIETGVDGMVVRSNILFGEGWTISNDSGSEVVIGYPYNAIVEQNSIYDQVYWTAGLRVNTAESTVVSNVIAGPYLPFMEGPAWGLISYPNNTVCSYEYYNTNTLDLVRVYKNDDEAKRAHIAVFNWASNDVVSVSLAGVLVAGDTYQLISAQNYAAGSIQTGTYNGTSISVPMTNLTVAPVLYGTNIAGELTSPRFAAFVVTGASGGGGGGIALPLK